MNWVGGSRNRLVMKSDAKKQKEFFEKRKMQKKLKKMGIPLTTSPGDTGPGSMDLVTLFIVNQIAAKKENKDPPKVAILGSSQRASRKLTKPLVLPMSPCSPSRLSLVESQPQYSVQEMTRKTHVIPQGFKCRQLSPVLESAFSDASASDYLPPTSDHLSPFSSTSSASSGQGIFPLKMQTGQTQTQLPPHCSPPPWDTSGLEHIKFQPFSQPRGMTDNMPWSCRSNPSHNQTEASTATQVLFRSPDPDEAKGGFSLNRAEDREHMLSFMLNQSGPKQQFEEDVFRGFSNEEYEKEASHFGNTKSKINVKDATPVKSSAPQTVPDSQCNSMELSNCSDMNFSCSGHNTGPVNGCGYSPSYSCGRGYLSSDSTDDEECCRPCLQASASSYKEQGWCADNSNQNSQGKAKGICSQPSTPSPQVKLHMSMGDHEKVVEDVSCPDKDSGSNSQQAGSSTAPFASSQTQSSEFCKCKTTPSEARDAATQTVAAETCNASTQSGEGSFSAGEFNFFLPPVDMLVQHPATGRQTDTAAKSETHTDPSTKPKSGGKHTPWSKKQTEAGSQSGSSTINQFTVHNSGTGKIFLQKPINPFKDVLCVTDRRGKDTRECGDERGRRDDGRLMKELSDNVREEVTSATRVNKPSGEAETLQEIADILLLLKQKKKEE